MSVFSSFAQSGERHFAALFGSRCILLIIQKAGGIQQLALINTMCNTDDWLWTSPSWPPPPHCDDDSIDAWLTLLNFICRLVNIAVNILCAKEIPQIMAGNFKPAASNIWSLSSNSDSVYVTCSHTILYRWRWKRCCVVLCNSCITHGSGMMTLFFSTFFKFYFQSVLNTVFNGTEWPTRF